MTSVKIVLVIDDDKKLTEMVANMLMLENHQAVICHKAEAAYDVAQITKPDLAIIDIFMPGMGGIEGIQALKKSDPNLKVIAMSGGWGEIAGKSAVQAAKKVGADGALSKPFTIEELLQNVNAFLYDEQTPEHQQLESCVG